MLAGKVETIAMSRLKVFGLIAVASVVVFAIGLGTRRSVTQQPNDSISKAPATVVDQLRQTLTDNSIWRLVPNSTRVHTVLPVTAGRKWPRKSAGELLSLALVEQRYAVSDPSSGDAEEGSASAFWVVEFATNTSITAGRVVGLIHPKFDPYYSNWRDAHFVYHPQLDKFLVITAMSKSSTGVSIFEVKSDQIHGVIRMILPERSADWPSELSYLAGAALDCERGFASEPSSDFDPSVIVGAKRHPVPLSDALDFFAYSPRHRQWAIVDFTHVALPSNSDRSSKPPIGPATTWQPVANSEKVIAACASRNLTVVEQKFQRQSDSGDESQVGTKAYWVLSTYGDVAPYYFLPPDESRRIECAQIVNIGLPHREPYYLSAAEIDGTELVIRYYSMTEQPKGSRPLELDTIPKDWPTRIEPTAELRIKSPVKKLEAFYVYGSKWNLIFGVADESSQAYFNHSQVTKEWTRLELSSRVRIKNEQSR